MGSGYPEAGSEDPLGVGVGINGDPGGLSQARILEPLPGLWLSRVERLGPPRSLRALGVNGVSLAPWPVCMVGWVGAY